MTEWLAHTAPSATKKISYPFNALTAIFISVKSIDTSYALQYFKTQSYQNT